MDFFREEPAIIALVVIGVLLLFGVVIDLARKPLARVAPPQEKLNVKPESARTLWLFALILAVTLAGVLYPAM